MNVTVISYFRNAVRYLERYTEQVDSLKKLLAKEGHELNLILGYGDSSDGTGEALFDECQNRLPAQLIDVSHGGPYYGSIVHIERFKQLSYVVNTLWSRIPDDADIVALVESDLIWKASDFMDLLELLEGLRRVRSDPLAHTLVAPMVMLEDGRFYDTWGFSYNGSHFRNSPPYHKALDQLGTYLEMNTVGSFVLMDAGIARKVNFPEQDLVVGLCKQARLLGARIFLDKLTKVYHPL